MLENSQPRHHTNQSLSPTEELARATHIASTRDVLACVYVKDPELSTGKIHWISKAEDFALIHAGNENRILAFCSRAGLEKNYHRELTQIRAMCDSYGSEYQVAPDMRSRMFATIVAKFERLCDSPLSGRVEEPPEIARFQDKLSLLPPHLLTGISRTTAFLLTHAGLAEVGGPTWDHRRSAWTKPSIIITHEESSPATLAEESTHALDYKLAFCFGPNSNPECRARAAELSNCITVLRGKGEEYLGAYSLIRNKNYFEYHPVDYGPEVLADLEAIPVGWKEISQRLAAVREVIDGSDNGESLAGTTQSRLITKLLIGVRNELKSDQWLTSVLRSESPDELCVGLFGARALQLRDQFRNLVAERLCPPGSNPA
jgi:hypothetical protein